MERLVLGLETEIGPPSVDAVGAGRSGLRMPVRIRLSPAIVDEVLEAFKEVGGVSVPESQQDDTMIVRFADHPEWMEKLARDKSLMRRVCVRLLSAEGLTIAIYSDFRAWSLSNWIAIDGSTLRIRRAHVLQSQARFDELTPEQVTTITSVRVTIDRVPQERATVRLDVQTVNDQPNAKETGTLSPESRSERYRRVTEQEESMSEGVLPLRALMEAAWFPPVTARPWSRGYRPGNDRTVVITLTLDPAKLRIREEPRLVLVSGDVTFDQTALAAARTGLQQWLTTRGPDSLSATAAVPSRGADPSALPLAALKVRAQFQLHQDVPALNLVGPRALAHPLMPLRSSPGIP
jgi:hypothetical protein